MENAITVNLGGGIGNQMFQYAAGRSLADKLNCDLVLDTSYFASKNNLNGVSPVREYCLNHFQVRVAKKKELSVIYYKRDNWLRYKIQKIFGNQSYVYKEKTFPFYDDSLQHRPIGTYLIGEFQSHKYFFKNEKRIENDLVFTTPLAGANADLAAQIAETPNSISLHFRRGDYLVPPFSKALANCPMEYYQMAANHIAQKMRGGQITCFIFSNDVEFVRNNLNIGHKAIIVDANDEKTGHFDMHLQSLCHHNIIANSSMSWWGAWLNDNAEKIVVAPKRWHIKPKNAHCTDMYPNDWIRL